VGWYTQLLMRFQLHKLLQRCRREQQQLQTTALGSGALKAPFLQIAAGSQPC
jgi:hypothetical protein